MTVMHPVVDPLILKTASVVITREGAPSSDDFSDHVGELTLTPTVSSVSWTGIAGNTVQDTAAPTWAATLGLIQDMDAAGLLRYLMTHAGEKAEVVATFKDLADTVTFDVTLVPAQVGGTPGQFATASATLPIDGTPAWSA